jgi:hypothetical protein
MVVALIGFSIAGLTSTQTKTITVQSKEDSPTGNSHNMLIQDENNNWYVVDDIMLRGIFNSRDTWGAMDEGATYTITYQGWRIHLFSVYPCIFKTVEVTPIQ